MNPEKIPVTLVTGFLGSGKTVLLNQLLRQPALDGAVVIVNEFGEVGLDHLLIEQSDEQFALLDNGCVCCTIRDDLVTTLTDLDRRISSGTLPPVNRVLIETTGLADPAPILHTFMVEPDIARRFCIGGVVTTVDAVNGQATLDRYAESQKQIAIADRIIVTKSDLATAQATAGLMDRIRRLAPTADRMIVAHGKANGADIFDIAGFDRETTPARITRWVKNATEMADMSGFTSGDTCVDHDHHDAAHYNADIQTYSFIIDEPVDWASFAQWLEYVTLLKGEDLLRMKGLVHVSEQPERPLVIHGVQHVIHPPARLDAWPDNDRTTRLVFIVRGIPRDIIERTLTKFAAIDSQRIHQPKALSKREQVRDRASL